MRKKMRLQICHSTSAKASRSCQLRLIDSKTGSVEHGLRGEDITAMFMLPVPEKAQRLQNFLIFGKFDLQPQLWTVGEGKRKPEVGDGEEDNMAEATRKVLDREFADRGLQVVVPTEEEFASEIVQAHKKTEKAYHVKAFKGSKEGTSARALVPCAYG